MLNPFLMFSLDYDEGKVKYSPLYGRGSNNNGIQDIRNNGIQFKMHFLATNGEKLAKRGFVTTMEQNTFFKKELYSIREFNTK